MKTNKLQKHTYLINASLWPWLNAQIIQESIKIQDLVILVIATFINVQTK